MASPNWNKITKDGKPFGHQSDGEKKALELVKTLEKENKQLKKDNLELLEMIEAPKKK